MKVLVTVTNTGWIHRNTVDMLLKLSRDRRFDVTLDLPKERPYENNLNHIARQVIEDGFDFWLQFDSDNAPTRNPLDLIELDKDTIFLPYLQWHCTPEDIDRGNYPLVALAMDDVGEGFKEHHDMSGLQRIDAAASGCMLIARRVLEAIELPFARTHDQYGRVDIGVDFNFCRKVRAAGFEVWAHYDYHALHFKEVEMTEVQRALGNYYKRKAARTTSSGRDLVMYCGPTREKWDGETHLERGIAGSEESVVYLMPELVKLGWNVTVYNNCEAEREIDGVLWRPYQEWNRFDRQDVTIIWRRPEVARQHINSERVFIDLQDVGHPDQLKGIHFDRVFVKSEFHKSLYRGVDPDKLCVIPNGIWFDQFQGFEKDPMLIINTSAPDRGLGTLIELFLKVRERVPGAKLAWAYGWSLFDELYAGDAKMMDWKETIIKAMEHHGIENLDRITHAEVAELCGRATVWAYPTDFSETCCISALKAQAAGAVPVTTSVGALKEYATEGWAVDKENWVDAAVRVLETPSNVDREKFRVYDWPNIAKRWDLEIAGMSNG